MVCEPTLKFMGFGTDGGGGISFPFEGSGGGWHRKDRNSLSAFKSGIDRKSSFGETGMELAHLERSCEKT